MENPVFNQIVAILAILKDIPFELVQKAIDSGFLKDFIRTCKFDTIPVEMERKRVETAWHAICCLGNGNLDEISITVAHYPNGYGNPTTTGPLQLRCWRGEHGNTRTLGHVDSGTANGELLFETTVTGRLESCRCCFSGRLNRIGIDLHKAFTRKIKFQEWEDVCDKDWVLEDRGVYDIITLKPKKPKEE